MSRGTFISVDSADTEIKHLYADIVENLADYEAYFIELGLRLESGDGYFYFSRPNESRITIEQKLQSFAQWVDILDFLKTFGVRRCRHLQAACGYWTRDCSCLALPQFCREQYTRANADCGERDTQHKGAACATEGADR